MTGKQIRNEILDLLKGTPVHRSTVVDELPFAIGETILAVTRELSALLCDGTIVDDDGILSIAVKNDVVKAVKAARSSDDPERDAWKREVDRFIEEAAEQGVLLSGASILEALPSAGTATNGIDPYPRQRLAALAAKGTWREVHHGSDPKLRKSSWYAPKNAILLDGWNEGAIPSSTEIEISSLRALVVRQRAEIATLKAQLAALTEASLGV